ncbi:hypothetical protein SLEP1_g41739 [Rubroshorea leprosula]|uniref:Uncharacterized protein n=1 Tax=Rubroshorea leprosula TaxID=152421 RepID=A0AAV5L7H4_9ROSI|nr:hypothetical protein SLEP1_g41739 [Rubroshorea leprosula]
MLVSRDCPCHVPLTINQQSDHCLYLASYARMHLGKEFLRIHGCHFKHNQGNKRTKEVAT